MALLTVTSRGQVTLKKEVLQHLASDKVAGFVGLLEGRTNKVATLEELDEAAAQAWSGKR